MIIGHGDDGYLFGKSLQADFSSNVNPEGCNPALLDHLREALTCIDHYPEANAQSLQRALAKHHRLPESEVLVTNGATEAFYLIAQAFASGSATIAVPAFAEYEDACKAAGLNLHRADWETLIRTTQFQTDLVFFGNPNNPTGRALSSEKVRELVQAHTEVVFVIDEAYCDFTARDTSVSSQLQTLPNVLLVHSLTKTYAIPGIRLGYILGSTALVNRIQEKKMPWSVNTLAIHAGLFILDHQSAVQLPLERLLTEAHQLAEALGATEGIQVLDSETTFMLCRTAKGTASELKNYLLSTYGLLIRDASNFHGLDATHFRIATQNPAKNQLLIQGIRAWIQQSF